MGSVAEIFPSNSEKRFARDSFDYLDDLLSVSDQFSSNCCISGELHDRKSGNDVTLDFLLDNISDESPVGNTVFLESEKSDLVPFTLDDLLVDHSETLDDLLVDQSNIITVSEQSSNDLNNKGFIVCENKCSQNDLCNKSKSGISNSEKHVDKQLCDQRNLLLPETYVTNCAEALSLESHSSDKTHSNLLNFLLTESDSKSCSEECDAFCDETTNLNVNFQGNVILENKIEGDDKTTDLDCSLADLYISEKTRSESFSDQSTVSDSSGSRSSLTEEQQLEEVIQFDSSPESGYCSEKERQTVNLIDLTSAKNGIKNKNCNLHDQIGRHGLPFSQGAYSVLKKSPLIRKKPSLFCKVLCCKTKTDNLSSVPQLPSDLTEILKSMDYWKYFSFDTPSPDDLVRQKQKKAFRKTKES